MHLLTDQIGPRVLPEFNITSNYYQIYYYCSLSSIMYNLDKTFDFYSYHFFNLLFFFQMLRINEIFIYMSILVLTFNI